MLAEDFSEAASEELHDELNEASEKKEENSNDVLGFSDVSSVKKSTQSMFNERNAGENYYKNMRNLKLKGRLQKKPK